jgi:lipid A 3-O-deacylase
MKYLVKISVVLLFALFSFAVEDAHAASLENGKNSGVYLNEIGIGSGYSWGTLKTEPVNLAVYPAFVRIAFNINSFAGIDGHQSTLQFALEPFVNSVSKPEAGIETGLGIGLRYLVELSGPVDLFTEASFAPMYLSIKSTEQGDAGFNFLLQAGAGLQYKVSSRTALFAGYRFRHISHGGLSDRPNEGINSNAIVAGLSLLY